MRTLRFHHEIYSAEAIEEALRAFEAHAELSHRQEAPYFEVTLTAKSAADEAALAGELSNYVLALTVEEKRAG
jgi:hypothetical protein